MKDFDHIFSYQDFSCEVAILESAETTESEEDSEYTTFQTRTEKLYMARFYARNKEHRAEKISDFVSVTPSYGYISIKVKTVEISTYNQESVLIAQKKQGGGLISGFLDERIFTSKEMVQAAIYFLIDIIGDVGYYYNISLVKTADFVEYNGEY
jgi:hypothetical protein